jgi:hypothetical protein
MALALFCVRATPSGSWPLRISSIEGGSAYALCQRNIRLETLPRATIPLRSGSARRNWFCYFRF